MKEYGNFYTREDIGWAYPSENYQIMRFIKTVQQEFPNERMKQRNWLEERIKPLFWPTDITDERILKRAGLTKRTETEMTSRGVYSKHVVYVSSDCQVEVKAFFDNHMWFYWWDRFFKGSLSSSIEFFPWLDHPASYILFATDAKQSPLLCTPLFVDAKIRKYNNSI